MNISELIQTLENTMEDAVDYEGGDTAIRLSRMYKDVIFYLIEKGDLNMSDRRAEFYKYIENFSPASLYKVASHYRKQKGMPELGYQQSNYH